MLIFCRTAGHMQNKTPGTCDAVNEIMMDESFVFFEYLLNARFQKILFQF